MANNNYTGGTAVQTQIDTLTPGGTIEVGDEFTVILTGEDGSVNSKLVVATGTSVAQVCDDIIADIAGLSEATYPLFHEITWSDETTHVQAVAKTEGKPFYLTETTTESGGGAADAQTFVQATTTANKGPQDVGTAENWSQGSKAAAGDIVRVMRNANGKSYDMRYGLNQGISIKGFKKSGTYRGTVGDTEQGFYLKYNVNNTDDSNVPEVVIDGDTGDFWLSGVMPQVNIYGTSQSKNAVRLDGDLGEVISVGPGVRGKVTVAVGAILDNFFFLNCPNGTYEIKSGVTSFDLLDADSGVGICDSACTLIELDWQAILRHTAGAVGTVVTKRGSHCYYNGNGTLTLADARGGIFETTENESESVIITQAIARGGDIIDSSGMNNVDWQDLIQRTGNVDVGAAAVVVIS